MFFMKERILFESPQASSRLGGSLTNPRGSFKWEWKGLSIEKPPTKGEVFYLCGMIEMPKWNESCQKV